MDVETLKVLYSRGEPGVVKKSGRFAFELPSAKINLTPDSVPVDMSEREMPDSEDEESLSSSDSDED